MWAIECCISELWILMCCLRSVFRTYLKEKPASQVCLLISFLKGGRNKKSCKLIQTNISFVCWNLVVFPSETFLSTSMYYNPWRIDALRCREAISPVKSEWQNPNPVVWIEQSILIDCCKHTWMYLFCIAFNKNCLWNVSCA